MSKNDKLPKSYSEAITELQELTQLLQSNGVEIDDLGPKMKRAELLIQYCKGKLRGLEQDLEESMNAE